LSVVVAVAVVALEQVIPEERAAMETRPELLRQREVLRVTLGAEQEVSEE
jgi:hypothetical protein